MRQQVNLYRTELSTRMPFPDFYQGMQVLGLLFLFILLLVFVQLFRLWQLDDDLAGIQTEVAEAEQALAQLQQQLPAGRMTAIEQQVEGLNAELLRLREVKGFMAGQKVDEQLFGNQHGFSRQFEGLSRQHLPGVSLSSVGMFKGGRVVELSGLAMPPEQAPRYLARLHGDEAFADVMFGQLQILRNNSGEPASFQVVRAKREAAQ